MKILKKYLLSLFLLSVIFSTGDLRAQWVKTGFQGRASMYSWYYFSSQYCYISPGFYRSSDGGQTWTTIPYGKPNLHVGPFTVHGDYIFALIEDPFLSGEGGMVRSSDRGDTWEKFSTKFTFGIDILMSDGNTIYGSCGDGIVYSTDNGNSWVAIHDSIYTVSSFVRSGTNLYASSYNGGTGYHDGGGVYRSSDSGLNWVTFNNSLTGMLHVANLVSLGNDLLVESGLGLSISSDSAVTWRTVFFTHDTAVTNTVAFDNSLFVIAQTKPDYLKNSILYSSDHAKKWKNVTGNLQGRLFSYLGSDGDNLFVETDSGLWRSPLSELGVEERKPTHSVSSLFNSLTSNENPFGDETELRFHLSESALLNMEIYDVLGHKLYKANQQFEAGDVRWHIEGKYLPIGMLYVKIWSKDNFRTLKLGHW